MSRGGLWESCLLFLSMHLIPGWACYFLNSHTMSTLTVSGIVMKVLNIFEFILPIECQLPRTVAYQNTP